MFSKQIEELRTMSERLCDEITVLEESAKEKRAQLRDMNQALSSLERVQAKYEPQDEDEVVECDN